MSDAAHDIETLAIAYSQGHPCPGKKPIAKKAGAHATPMKYMTDAEKKNLIDDVLEAGFPINRIWIFPWYEDEKPDSENERIIDVVCGLDESAEGEPIYIEGALRYSLFDASNVGSVHIRCIWDNAFDMFENGVFPTYAPDWEKPTL